MHFFLSIEINITDADLQIYLSENILVLRDLVLFQYISRMEAEILDICRRLLATSSRKELYLMESLHSTFFVLLFKFPNFHPNTLSAYALDLA